MVSANNIPLQQLSLRGDPRPFTSVAFDLATLDYLSGGWEGGARDAVLKSVYDCLVFP